jgi:tetratricopeptide (TPR) repeat protein
MVRFVSLMNGEKEMASLKEQSQQNTENYENFFNLGIQFKSEGKDELAIENFTKAIELNPNDANAYIERARAYKYNDFNKALNDYTKAIELNPNEADFYIKRADAYHYSGYDLYYYDDYDTLCKSDIFYKALNDYTKAIELNPNCYNAYYARAMFHQQLDYSSVICDEQALNAIPDYTKVIELAPDENYAYYNRAQCYQFLKEYNKAIADYSKCLELDDKYHCIYNDRGYCYEELKEYDKAIADYSKAIEMDYPISFPYFRRANCYHNLKKYDEALADYSKGFKLGRGITLRDFFNGGELYKELGDYERAFKCFDYGIKSCKDSKDKEKYARLAHDTAMSINDYNRAKNYLEQLTSLEEHKEVYLGNIDKAEQLEQLNKQLDEKNKELNNLIAMFAHNFLGTLQCIRSNAEHDNNAKIHLKTVKMMSGALTAFSIISADDDKLIEQLKQDNTGETNLLQNLANNLALAISQLLSKTNKAKIINLYLNYLCKTNHIEKDTTSEELKKNKDYREKWQALQHQWEDEFNALFSENVELSSLQNWLADNFFPVQITGFDNYNIRFEKYGITDSIFLVIFMEILVNVLKYMDISQNKPLILTLEKQDQHYHLICENPSSQETYRGTHKGMDFLKSIARKLNAQFITESTEQQFKTIFIIPAELLD